MKKNTILSKSFIRLFYYYIIKIQMQDELKPLLARGNLKQSLTLIYDLFWLNRLFRFPMMTPAQLADLLLSPLLRRHMEFMMERMAGAMAL